MKIAVVTDDQVTISRHFGRAPFYLVFIVEDGQVVQQELRPKLGHDQFRLEEHHDHDEEHHEHGAGPHGHGHGQHSQDKHRRMMANLGDCQVLLCGGMGMGAYESLQRAGITPILTEVRDISAAVRAYIAGTLEDHKERLH